MCLAAQLCLTFCDPVGCSPPGSSAHGDSPGKNTGVGCHFLLQGIFPTQGSNPDLPHCRRILYRLSHPGSPYSIQLVHILNSCWSHPLGIQIRVPTLNLMWFSVSYSEGTLNRLEILLNRLTKPSKDGSHLQQLPNVSLCAQGSCGPTIPKI